MDNSYVECQEQLYRTVEDPWCNINPNNPRYRMMMQLDKTVLSLFLDKPRFVVDIGCGLGGLVDRIYKAFGCIVLGVDSSSTAVEKARNMFPHKYVVGDIRTWVPPGDCGAPDVVLASGSYHHLPETERKVCLGHIHKYLAPRGVFVVVYGGDYYVSGKTTSGYPSLAAEIFSVFAPQQIVSRQIMDNEIGQEASWVFYVGEKR